MTRSDTANASDWSWVTYTTVSPRLCCSSRMSSRTLRRSLASRLDSGSSNSSTWGSSTNARATATRCCCPPDNSDGKRSSSPASPTSASFSRAWACAGSLRRPPACSPYATLSITFMCGNRAYDWNTILTSRSEAASRVTSLPPMSTRPPLAVSRPAIMRSVVVLPHPDGPSSVTRVPASTVKLTWSTAVNLPKVLLTFSNTTLAAWTPISALLVPVRWRRRYHRYDVRVCVRPRPP